MANINSSAVAEFVAQPATFPNVAIHGARDRVNSTTIPTAGALSINDTLRFSRIPVDSPINSIKLAADDLGSTGVIDLGFYEVGDAGAAVDQNAIAVGIDVSTAATALTEFRFSALDINTVEQRAWELAGLSEKPDFPFFDVVGTVTTATTAAGDVTLVIKYQID